MEKIIEKNKTYRVPKKDGSTDLYQVLLIIGDSIKVKDLKNNMVRIFNKSTFEKKLNEGTMYVSAEDDSSRNKIIMALKKIIKVGANSPRQP